jgi:hypothetical protein
MDTLQWILLESRLALGVIVALALFALVVHWRRTLRARPLLIGLGVAFGLFVLQTAVTTRREHAASLLGRLEQRVVESDADGILPLLSPGFRAGSWDADEFLEFVRAQMRWLDVASVRRTRTEFVESNADAFAAEVAYTATVSAEQFRGFVESVWWIEFGRTADGGWGISGIEPRSLNRVGIRDWETLERY